MEDRSATPSSLSAAAASEGNDTNGPSLPFLPGVRSGEIFVRVRGPTLTAAGGALEGLAPTIRTLALARPTLPQAIASSQQKLQAVRRQRQHAQERRRLVRQRYDATRAAMATLAKDSAELVVCGSVSPTREAFAAACERLASLYQQHAMDGVLQYYALLEEERARIAAWRANEFAACQELVRTAKRRHHITSFAVHVESETSGQIRLWRLVEGDAQRARCVKAASENVKKGFFRTEQIEVTDVYKIDNRPLSTAFERWVSRHAAGTTNEPKVKGLFCSVPTESLEHCVVWGMFRDEYALTTSTGALDQPIFNRPTTAGLLTADEAPGTQRRFVAHQRVREASPMQFPRRFSRYSTLDELRSAAASDLAVDEPPSRYLALCRVAMGKTQRVTSAAVDAQFPANELVGSLFFSDEEEYTVRYPEMVVPEFLVEYRFVPNSPPERATSPNRVIPVPLSGDLRESLPSTAFESSATKVLDELRGEQLELRSRGTSLLTHTTSLPSVFNPPVSTPSASPHEGLADDEISTEKALEVCGSRRRIYMDDFEQTRRLLWRSIKTAWDTLDVSRQPAHQMSQVRQLAQDNERTEVEEKPPAKRQSLKAKKLYGELALERQMQANEVARLDALVKNKLSLNGKFKKKDGQPIKPRPFR